MKSDFDRIQSLSDHRRTIQASRLLLQAKAPRKDGKTHIVAVYEMSDEQFFFFTYTAKTTRTPRRLWKIANWHIIHEGRKFDPTGKDKTVDFRHFLKSQQVHIVAGAKWSVRYPYKKNILISCIKRVSDPDRTPILVPGATFDYASAITSGRRPSKSAYQTVNRIWKRGQ